MKNAGRRLFPAWKFAVLALVAGAASGLGAVYLTGGQIEVASADPPPTGGCAAAVAAGESLRPFAVGDVAAMAPVETEKPLPALSFTRPDGGPGTYDALPEKLRLVNLWATWCVPCREEMPSLAALQGEAGGENFEVLAINIDTGDAEKPQKFLDEIGVSALPLYRDPSMGVFNALKKEGLAFGLPATFLVDRRGCVVAAMNGPAEWAGGDALSFVRRAVELDRAASGT